MEVLIASDHAGFELKTWLQKQPVSIDNQPLQWIDLGPSNTDRVDYPDFADRLCQKLSGNEFGILICGSGQGMAMRANRYRQHRAALCWDTVTAKLARAHNNANILCLGGRLIPQGLCIEILQTFLSTPFEGQRHDARVVKLGNELPGSAKK